MQGTNLNCLGAILVNLRHLNREDLFGVAVHLFHTSLKADINQCRRLLTSFMCLKMYKSSESVISLSHFLIILTLKTFSVVAQ